MPDQATLPSPPDTLRPMMRGVYIAYVVVGWCYIGVSVAGYWAFGINVAGTASGMQLHAAPFLMPPLSACKTLLSCQAPSAVQLT